MGKWGDYLDKAGLRVKKASFLEMAEKAAPALDDVIMLAVRKMPQSSKADTEKKGSEMLKEGFGRLAAGLTGAGLGGLAGAASSREGGKLRGALTGAALGAAGGIGARKASQHILGKPVAKKLVGLGWKKGAPLTGAAAEEGRNVLQRYRTGLEIGAGAGGLGAGAITASLADKVAFIKAAKEALTGGKADYRPNSDFSSKQLAMGKKIEKEHTQSPLVAKEIARDHLSEIPDYYTRLEKMEDEAMSSNARVDKIAEAPSTKPISSRQDLAELIARGAGGLIGGGLLGYLGQRTGSTLLSKITQGYGGAVVGGVSGGLAGSSIYGALRGKPKGELLTKQKSAKAKVADARCKDDIKQASLDHALGLLYQKYGPPLQKHAALEFFNYSLDKSFSDKEGLGQGFCKLAEASGLDPWHLALKVATNFPNIQKLAFSSPSKEQEVASFYVSWADGILKKAGILSSIRNATKRAPSSASGKVVEEAAKDSTNVGNYLRGAAILSGVGLGSSAAAGHSNHLEHGDYYA